MLTSIVHRITGVALTIGTAGLAWWLMALASGPDAYATFSAIVFNWAGQIIVIGFIWALSFHFLNGIRHLVWDIGHGFTPKVANRASILILIGSVLLTIAVYLYGLFSFGVL